jgi:hypothetical protein
MSDPMVVLYDMIVKGVLKTTGSVGQLLDVPSLLEAFDDQLDGLKLATVQESIDDAVAKIVDAAPDDLNTLREIAEYMSGEDTNIRAAILAQVTAAKTELRGAVSDSLDTFEEMSNALSMSEDGALADGIQRLNATNGAVELANKLTAEQRSSVALAVLATILKVEAEQARASAAEQAFATQLAEGQVGIEAVMAEWGTQIAINSGRLAGISSTVVETLNQSITDLIGGATPSFDTLGKIEARILEDRARITAVETAVAQLGGVDLADMGARITAAEATIATLNGDESTMGSFRNVIASTKTDITNATNQKINAVKGDPSTTATLSSLDQAVQDNVQLIGDLQNKDMVLEAATTTVASDLNALKGGSTQTQSQQDNAIANAAAAGATNATEITAVKGRVTTAEQKITAAEGAITNQAQSITDITTKTNANEQLLVTHDQKISALAQKDLDLQSNIDIVDANVTTVSENLQAANSYVQEYTAKVDKLVDDDPVSMTNLSVHKVRQDAYNYTDQKITEAGIVGVDALKATINGNVAKATLDLWEGAGIEKADPVVCVIEKAWNLDDIVVDAVIYNPVTQKKTNALFPIEVTTEAGAIPKVNVACFIKGSTEGDQVKLIIRNFAAV